MKYWILIREAHLGRPQKSLHLDLLYKMKQLVSSNKGLFPISQTLFLELNKQSDRKTRQATAQLMDELSRGISICGLDERIEIEIRNFLHERMKLNTYKIVEHVWTKSSCLFGLFDSPVNDIKYKKSFIDYLWRISLVDILTIMGGKSLNPDNRKTIADKLNSDNVKHSDEIKSFEQTYLYEIAGVLDLFKKFIADTTEKIFLEEASQDSKITKEEKEEGMSKMYVLFVNLFKLGKVSKYMPTADTYARCHASIRWDKRRKIDSNDIYDIEHATEALGYYDAFLTEKSFKTLLTTKHISAGDRFGCTVISEEKKAIQYLDTIGDE